MIVSRSKLAVLTMFLAAALCGATRADDAELRYKFKEGDKLNYSMEQKMNMEISIAGQNITMDMDLTVTMTWKVGEVDKDGKAKVTQSFDRVQVKMKHPQGGFEFDSKDGKEPDDDVAKKMIPILKAMAGADVTMTMDKRGQVADLQMSDKLKEALKKAGGGVLGDLGSEEGMKKLVEQGALVLPEGSISKGKSWNAKNDIKMPQIGKVITDTKYTYEGQEKRSGKTLEKISGAITQSIEMDKNSAITMTVKSQDSKGTIYFDNTAGRLIEAAMTQEVVMEIGGGGQTGSQKIKQNVTVKLLDGK